MSRYTGPRQRINRRFSQAIFPVTAAVERKPYVPGQHGPTIRRKVKEYSTGLIEKQKIRFLYGLSEKQFRRTFDQAKQIRGVTGTIMLRILETRLDNVVYRVGFAKTRAASRQFVNHGHILVNGKKVDIPSYIVKTGDIVEVKDCSSSKQVANGNLEASRSRTVPGWLTVTEAEFKAVVNRQPEREEMEQNINEQVVVEFYSR